MARRVFSTVTSASPGHLGETALVPEGIRGFAVESRVGTAFGKYNIISLLGKGGMGEVYEAYDTDKNRTVALKILADGLSNDATFRERFQRESHAAAVLQEPHVIPIHDWGEIDGRLYIDMRLVRGQTLDELIAKGPLEPARAIAIIGQVAAALDAAHAEGLMHRDIKPHNVVVTEADFAYLVDFGIAEARGDTRLTTAGTPIGTVNYMAPERFNQQNATPAVDARAGVRALRIADRRQSLRPGQSRESGRGSPRLATSTTERHQSARSGGVRRGHCPRHGQGPR
jgi:serine/threonine protein kinase